MSGGTDNHLMVVDLRPFDAELTGKVAQTTLDEAGITLNKNTVPNDPRSPFVTSGLRIGTPSVTTQGMREPEMATIAALIARALRDRDDAGDAGGGQGRSRRAVRQVPALPRRRELARSAALESAACRPARRLPADRRGGGRRHRDHDADRAASSPGASAGSSPRTPARCTPSPIPHVGGMAMLIGFLVAFIDGVDARPLRR